MKTMKKVFALVLALAMMLSLAVSVVAADPDTPVIHVVTIKYVNGDHVFNAYQIFKGDLTVTDDGDKILSNITWGSGVDSVNLIVALKADATIGSDVSTAIGEKTGDEAAVALSEYLATLSPTGDKAKIDAFTALVKETKATATNLTAAAADDGFEYTAELEEGYYVIFDETTLADDAADAISYNMLQIVGDVTITAKADAPKIEKKIVVNEEKGDASTAAIGDDVNYEITSKVPDMTGYDNYAFIMTDTLSDGLTFNDDVVVKIGTSTLTNNDDYKIVTDSNTFKIVFINFIKWNVNNVGDDIVVTYSAKINENAVVGDTGNSNKIDLTYSNNPNFTGTGDWNDENPNTPTGTTPKDIVVTYVTNLELFKYHLVDGEKVALEGVTFTLEGEYTPKLAKAAEQFDADENGIYWKLTNGTYTTTDPETEGVDQSTYESTTVKYTKTIVTEYVDGDKVTVKDENKLTGTNGIIDFGNIGGSGKFTLTEIKTVDGFNLLKEPITFEIKWTAPEEVATDTLAVSSECTWEEVVAEGAEGVLTKNADGTFKIEIENKTGSTLPETGGIGTTIFYVVGGIMMLAAVVVLVTMKKMNAKSER